MAAHRDDPPERSPTPQTWSSSSFTRAGDSAAFGELWVRHSARVAPSHAATVPTPTIILSEGFARVFQAISAGGGPTSRLPPLPLHHDPQRVDQWARAKSADASEDLDLIADPSTEEDASLAALDKSLTANAFRSLPTRWQEALWYSEVEQLSSRTRSPHCSA